LITHNYEERSALHYAPNIMGNQPDVIFGGQILWVKEFVYGVIVGIAECSYEMGCGATAPHPIS